MPTFKHILIGYVDCLFPIDRYESIRNYERFGELQALSPPITYYAIVPTKVNGKEHVFEIIRRSSDKPYEDIKKFHTFSLNNNMKDNFGTNVIPMDSIKSKAFDIEENERILELKIVANGGKIIKPRKGSYESMTVKELQVRCSKRGMKYAGLRKAELIGALRKNR